MNCSICADVRFGDLIRNAFSICSTLAAFSRSGGKKSACIPLEITRAKRVRIASRIAIGTNGFEGDRGRIGRSSRRRTAPAANEP